MPEFVFLSTATGFDGDQALAVQLLQLGGRKRQVINGEPLPLSPKSYLSWLGFTAEGSFCLKASAGVGCGDPRLMSSPGSLRNPVLRGFRRDGPDAEPLPG